MYKPSMSEHVLMLSIRSGPVCPSDGLDGALNSLEKIGWIEEYPGEKGQRFQPTESGEEYYETDLFFEYEKIRVQMINNVFTKTVMKLIDKNDLVGVKAGSKFAKEYISDKCMMASYFTDEIIDWILSETTPR